MHISNIPESKKVEYFYKFNLNSEFTFEGIDLDNKKDKQLFCKEFEKTVRGSGYDGPELIGYYYHGSDMNEVFNLTGSNAYSDDLGFLTIEGLHSGEFKQMCNARWFDDICSNNSIKQNAIIFGHEPDFDYEDDNAE